MTDAEQLNHNPAAINYHRDPGMANARFYKAFELAPGDRIAITTGGDRFVGVVLTAEHWGARDGWFIEIDKDFGGYGYWKQGCDGGVVEKL